MTGETPKNAPLSDALRWQARFDGQDEAADGPNAPPLERSFSAIRQALRKDTADALDGLSFAGFEAVLLAKLEKAPARPAIWRRALLFGGAGTVLCLALFGAFLAGRNLAEPPLAQNPGVVVEGLALQNEKTVKVFEVKGEAKQVTVIWLGDTER